MKTNVESIIARMGSQGSGRKDGNGRIQKKVSRKQNQLYRHPQTREEESSEVKAYLNKLQDIVPLMPKNKRLSKLEVISNVIEYIRDLRQTLGLPASCANDEDIDFDFMESDSSMIPSLSQTSIEAKPMAIAKLTVINNDSNSSMDSSKACCHPHPSQTRQPLVAIANPTRGGSS